jgi:uncharacterized protein YcbK (DUF882 family)
MNQIEPGENEKKSREFANKLIKLAQFAEKSLNKKISIFAFFRTAEEQKKYFDAGLSKADGYEKKSMHQLGRAVDIVILDNSGMPVWEENEDYHKLGQYWEERLGGRWGGTWYKQKKTSFNDIYHFEY